MSEAEKQPVVADKMVQINAQVLLSQRKLLNEKARSAEMNVSQFISKLITDATVEVSIGLPQQIRELNVWLARINSNLNMLSKHANIYKEKADAAILIHSVNIIREDIERVAAVSSTEAQHLMPTARQFRTAQRKKKAVKS
ncbi:plasmid mobilization protein [Pseudomonas sp. LB3P58]